MLDQNVMLQHQLVVSTSKPHWFYIVCPWVTHVLSDKQMDRQINRQDTDRSIDRRTQLDRSIDRRTPLTGETVPISCCQYAVG